MRYAASRHGFECVTKNSTTERSAPLPSPGRGRWREAPDEGPFCEAKRWGVSPIKRTSTVIAPHQSAALRETAAASCLAAARSRRGSGLPPAAHSLPRRRFATPGEAARCGGDGGQDGSYGLPRRFAPRNDTYRDAAALDRSMEQARLSLRDQFANWSRQSVPLSFQRWLR